MPVSAYMNMKEVTNIFKALSDNTRLRIIRLLIRARKELCVCEIMDSLQESQYNISRHLKELKSTNLVKERRDGRWVFYSIAETTEEFQRLIFHAVESIPKEVFLMDVERLKARLSLREGGKCVVGLENKEWKRVLNQLLSRRGRK